MSGELVSCIIPVFNGARFLRDAIESVLLQTFAPVEILVADDGSTDDTPAVAASFGSRIVHLRQANAGPSAARNLGLAHAAGSFVAFLDADDLWHPEKLRKQMARFAQRPELDLCFAHVENFWMREGRDAPARTTHSSGADSVPGYVSGTLLARRRAFDTVGHFDARLLHGSDTEWLLRARTHGVIEEMLSEVLYRRRLHGGNRSLRFAARSREAFVDLVKNHLDRRRDRSPGSGPDPCG